MCQKQLIRISFIITIITCLAGFAEAQGLYKPIALPANIKSINEEYSGMAIYNNRLYLEPQYGDHKETKLDGDFMLYSILTDSISRVIDGKDSSLTKYKTLNIRSLNQLPDSVKRYYEGFEAISIVNNTVYLSIETTYTYGYCFLLKGKLDTANNQVIIDPKHIISLKRYPQISNAGFESVTYLPKENKLLAYYEFNGMPKGGCGYLIDTSFKKAPQGIKTPFLYFRITDITATKDDNIYGINYFWSGDYTTYLYNKWMSHQETNISKSIPDLRDSIRVDSTYLTLKTTTYARIVMLNNRKDKQWKQVRSFEGYKNNWEGLSLFRKGALVVTDANRSSKQLTTLAYMEF